MRLVTTVFALVLCSISGTAQYWQSSDGPPSATTCMAIDSKGRVFVGTPYSKVYRTTDQGRSWDALDQGIDDGGPTWFIVNQLTVDAKDHLYIGVNGLGVLRSTNNGDSWTKLDIGQVISRQARISVAVKNAAENVTQIFVGYDAGASNLRSFFSDNGGTSFVNIPITSLPSGTSSLFDVFLSPNSDKMFISVAYNKGLFRTTNRGVQWRRIDAGDGNSNESDDLYQTFASDPQGRLYVGRNALPSSTKTKNAVVLRSSDDGETWEYLLSGWDNTDVTNNRISAISFGPNGDMWVGTEKNSGPFRSPNYGELFTVMRDGLPGDGSVAGVAVSFDNNVYVAPIGEPVHHHIVTTSVDERVPFVVRTGLAPNPSTDRVGVTLTSEVSTLCTVDLLSITGERVIGGYTIHLTPGAEQRLWLSTSELPTGVYMVRATSGSGVTLSTLVVAR